MDAEQDAHFQLMKRLLVIIPLSAILILLILCVVLGVNLYEAKQELRALREQAVPAMAVGQASDSGEQSGELYTSLHHISQPQRPRRKSGGGLFM